MKDDVICVARYRQVGHGTVGLRELPIVIWPLVIYGSWFKVKGSWQFMVVPDSELENYVSREFPAISEEHFKTIEMMVKLRKKEQSIHEMSSYPDAESREDYKLKVEEIGRYLASIRPIVGRKVTASYRRKLGLCS